MFGIAVDMHIGVLSGKNRTETEIPEMEIVSCIYEGTELVAAGVSACESSTQQCLPARVIAIVAAVYAPVDVKSLIPIGGIQAAAAGIDVHVSQTQARPRMSIGTKDPNC